jgi:hypothetical protein
VPLSLKTEVDPVSEALRFKKKLSDGQSPKKKRLCQQLNCVVPVVDKGSYCPLIKEFMCEQ